MTDRERVRYFDERLVELEGKRNSGMGGIGMEVIMVNFFSVFLMLIPIRGLVQALGTYWVVFQGVLLYLGGYFRMQWLLTLTEGGKKISWKEFLKYVPVDWGEYRRHRYQVLLIYTGKMFLCFAVLQAISQVFSGALKTGYRWQGLAYVAVMCFCWILAPGVIRIWRRG